MNPSPFDVGRQISQNIGSVISSNRDVGAIESIIDRAVQSNDPQVIQNSIGKILSSVSPERQPQAIKFLEGALQNSVKKQQRAALEKSGVNPDLPPALQKIELENRLANERAQGIINRGRQPQGSPSIQPGQGIQQGIQQNAGQPNGLQQEDQQGLPGQQQSGQMPVQDIQQGQVPFQEPTEQGEQGSIFQGLTDGQLIELTSVKGISEPAKQELRRRQQDRKTELKERNDIEKEKRADLRASEKQFDSVYDANKEFINETTTKYKSFESDTKPRLLQMRNIRDEDLVGPTAAVFLESLGIPLGALEDPSSELYQKLSLDLLKGLPETYGNRILKVEVDNFLKTIPSLMNSANGRRMIASNMLKLGEMKEVYYNEMRREQKAAFDSGKFPRDFQQRVFDQVKPQIDRINNEFVKLSEIKSVPQGTVPFFNPNGEVEFVPKEHAQWASENGGRRIW